MTRAWPTIAAAVNAVTGRRAHAHVLKWATAGAPRRAPLRPTLRACARVDAAAGTPTGTGTDLLAAAMVLHAYLRGLLAGGARRFFVVLVSDGAGNAVGLDAACAAVRWMVDAAGAALELNALGVGAAFPTAVAMRMRAALHRGRPSVPPLTVVAAAPAAAPLATGLPSSTPSSASYRPPLGKP